MSGGQNLAEMKAETARKLAELEAHIEKAKIDSAEIRRSGDTGRYWVASMLERQTARAQKLVSELRPKYE